MKVMLRLQMTLHFMQMQHNASNFFHLVFLANVLDSFSKPMVPDSQAGRLRETMSSWAILTMTAGSLGLSDPLLRNYSEGIFSDRWFSHHLWTRSCPRSEKWGGYSTLVNTCYCYSQKCVNCKIINSQIGYL